MFKYLFGPVPSRRLGMSLGVDLVPKKVCSLDCVYCEVGKTTCLTDELREYIRFADIKKELKLYFQENPDPDYITFSGSGEPTLNEKIGKVLDYIKKIRPEVPIAVLTNGTLFFKKELRQAILGADLLMPSLDAATEEVFRKINRPASNIKINKCIDGLAEFRKEFNGKIWLEIFILPAFNDTEKELNALKKAILRIKPDSVQLNTLDRPGTEEGLFPANHQELKKIVDLWKLDNVKIIASAPKRKKIKSYRRDTENTILETIARRPCTLDDLCAILDLHVNEINKYLDVLEKDKKIKTLRENRGIFYKLP